MYSIQKWLKKKESGLVPSKYVEYCEEEGGKLPMGLFYEYKITRWLSYVSFPRFQSSSATRFLLELDAEKARQKHVEEPLSVEINSITEPLYRNLVPTLTDDFHVWMEQMNRYLTNLPVSDKFALMAMTRFSPFHVQEWLLDGSALTLHKRLSSWKRLAKLRGYLPIFFPLSHQINSGIILLKDNDLKKRWEKMRKWKTRYEFVMEHVVATLSYEDTLRCVRLLAEQVLTIMNGAPRTKSRMTLYRGSKTAHMPGKAFVSTSLNPFHTLRYMENAGEGSCCLMRILVPRGSHLLFLGGFSPFEGEQEFLLPPSQYHKTREEMVMIPEINEHYVSNTNRCPKRGKRVRMIDMVLL